VLDLLSLLLLVLLELWLEDAEDTDDVGDDCDADDDVVVVEPGALEDTELDSELDAPLTPEIARVTRATTRLKVENRILKT